MNDNDQAYSKDVLNLNSISEAIIKNDVELIKEIAPIIEDFVNFYHPEKDVHLAIISNNLEIVKILVNSFKYFNNKKVYEKCLEWSCLKSNLEMISYFLTFINKPEKLEDFYINIVANRGLIEETRYLRRVIKKKVTILNNYSNKEVVDFVLSDDYYVKYHDLLKMIKSNRVDLFRRYYLSFDVDKNKEEIFNCALSTENYKTVYEILSLIRYKLNYNYLYILFARFNETELLNIIKLNLYTDHQRVFVLSLNENKVMISYYIISNYFITISEHLFSMIFEKKMNINNKILSLCEKQLKIEKIFEILCEHYEFKLADRYKKKISFWRMLFLKCKMRKRGYGLILNYLKEKSD